MGGEERCRDEVRGGAFEKMNLFGWFKVKKNDVTDQKSLLRDLQEVSSLSQASQLRIDRIIDIEKVRLRNLELRAEVVARARVRANG